MRRMHKYALLRTLALSRSFYSFTGVIMWVIVPFSKLRLRTGTSHILSPNTLIHSIPVHLYIVHLNILRYHWYLDNLSILNHLPFIYHPFTYVYLLAVGCHLAGSARRFCGRARHTVSTVGPARIGLFAGNLHGSGGRNMCPCWVVASGHKQNTSNA
jgi:hypothetical protein